MSTVNPVLSGAVTAVLVIAMVLAFFGVVSNVGILVTSAFSDQVMAITMPLPAEQAGNPAVKNFHAAYRQALLLGVPVALVKLVLSGLFLWSAIGVFRRVPGAQSSLSRWLLFALVAEIPMLGAGMLSQYLMYQPTQEYYRVVAPQILQMGALPIIFGVVFAIVFSLAKIVFYVIARTTLNKPS
ncbi:MAG: hypothetical protein JNM18_15480 [Planctomycetaceae bacterium]|nr:hypothetical protein [Planctomycetaceae bacterium]